MSRPSVGGRISRTQVPLSAAPVTMASNCLSDFSRKQQRGSGLVDLTLNLGGGIFLIGAVLGEVRQFRDGVGQWRTGQRGFQEPLRDEIRKAPVRRGGMRVIFHRQREMSGRFAAGKIQRIFAAPDELDDGQGKIGELFRCGCATSCQKSFERDGIRCGGERFLEFSREFDDARPAFGIAQDAAKDGNFLPAR